MFEQRRGDDFAQRGIVGEHREHGVARKRFSRRRDDLRAQPGQLLGLFRRAVPHAHLVPGFQNVCNHRGAHLAETDKTDVHLSLRLLKNLK